MTVAWLHRPLAAITLTWARFDLHLLHYTPAEPLVRRQPGASLIWFPNHPDSPVTKAGDLAALACRQRQLVRDAKYRGRPRHAAWLTDDITGEFAVVVEGTYPKELVA